MTGVLAICESLVGRYIRKDPLYLVDVVRRLNPLNTCSSIVSMLKLYEELLESQNILFDPAASLEAKFGVIFQCNSTTAMTRLLHQLPFWMLWRLWKNRNLLIQIHWRKTLEQTIFDAKEWWNNKDIDQKKKDLENNGTQRQTRNIKVWTIPPH